MDYYKILLVDDEEEVRTSIMKKIPWETLGFRLVGDAENGEDALEKAAWLEPDLLLTDIRMPYMDGLELAERVKEERDSIEVVFFSGFDDFQYAQRAIKLNAMEYILKPIDEEELTQVLQRLRERMDKKLEQARDISMLRENYRRTLPILREYFLNELVRDELSEQEILDGFSAYQLPVAHAQSWAIVSIDIQVQEGDEELLPLHQEKELFPVSVWKLAEERLGEEYQYTVFLSGSAPRVQILFGFTGNAPMERLIHRLKQIGYDCRRILGLEVTIGIGRTYGHVLQIARSYRESREAIGYRAILGSLVPIYIKDVEAVEADSLTFDERKEHRLLETVKFGIREEIQQEVDKLMNEMESARVHSSQCQVYMMSIFQSLIKLMQQYQLNTADIWGGEKNYYHVLERLMTAQNTRNFLLNTCFAINENISRGRAESIMGIVEQAKRYLELHYMEPDLSAEAVCRQLHISSAYFSTVFKKETGENYISWLTNLRLEKAVELLIETEDKTYMIAARVGYPEPNYFSHVFKKKYGISPNKYRQRAREEQR